MSAADDPRYRIELDDKYGSLSLIDIPAEIAAHEPWFNLMVEAAGVDPTGD